MERSVCKGDVGPAERGEANEYWTKGAWLQDPRFTAWYAASFLNKYLPGGENVEVSPCGFLLTGEGLVGG
jgi:hypothetical protein